MNVTFSSQISLTRLGIKHMGVNPVNISSGLDGVSKKIRKSMLVKCIYRFKGGRELGMFTF